MKKIILAFVLLFGISTPCLAEWGKEDTTLLILQLIDWGQTRTIATEKVPTKILAYPDGSKEILEYDYKYSELNPFLGEHPSIEKVNTYFSLCILTNYLIAKYTSDKFHKFWTYSSITMECLCINKNYNIKARIKF